LEKNLILSFVNEMDEELYVVSDPFRLSQLLNNIISNAIKFTDTGSVSVETKLMQKEHNSIVVDFCISDTGIGIPSEKLAEIFEPFAQASTSVSRMYGGTGLGLSICKQLIQMMGGKFEVESLLGKGSKFKFTIPYKTIQSLPKENKASDAIFKNELGIKKVLLVEDVELNQFLARHMMQSWGFEVELAINGKEAIEKIDKNSYDLVLMDIQMPVMNGIEATKIIRKMSDLEKRELPIIALTANALKGDGELYIAAGMNDYLTKPFDELKLYNKIFSNLSNAKLLVKGIKGSEERLDPLIQSEVLFSLKEIDSIADGDAAFLKEMLAMFVSTMPEYIEEMKGYLSAKDWVNLSRSAHKIKASVHTMGIRSIYETIQAIEDKGKGRGSKRELESMVNQVVLVMQCVVEDLKKIVL
jgi:hypothetical protein